MIKELRSHKLLVQPKRKEKKMNSGDLCGKRKEKGFMRNLF